MTGSEEKRAGTWRWGFVSSASVVLVCMVLGQAIGTLLERFPPTQALTLLLHGDRIAAREVWGALPGSLLAKDWLFAGFLLAVGAWLWVQRSAVHRFFRSMTTGVALVTLTLLAVVAGVLVPQIEGFEDPDRRVGVEGSADWDAQYQTFRFAEGYFLYHLAHPYGIGMPEVEVPAQAVAGLESFGLRYGVEERKNRETMMQSAFRGPVVSQAIEDLCARHEEAFKTAFRVATWLDLNRTYKSNWFATLLLLLGTAVFFNTFRAGWRKWLTIEKVGFFVTHCGMMILLAGGLVSKLCTDRGILHMDLRDPTPQDTYFRHFMPDKQARMPFAVRLDRFGRRDWKQIEVYFKDDDFSSRVPQYTLWPDRTIGLDFPQGDAKFERPRLEVHVKHLADQAEAGTAFLSESYDAEKPADVMPYAELEVPRRDPAGAGVRERVLYTPLSPRAIYFDPGMAFRLKVAYGAGLESDPARLFPAAGEDMLGTIELSVDGQGDGEPVRAPFAIGSSFDLPGGWRVVVDRAVGNFRLDPKTHKEVADARPLAEQPPDYPAVWIKIHPPDGKPPAERFLLDGIDWVEQGMQNQWAYPKVRARFDWDFWRAPGPKRYALVWASGSAPALCGEDGAKREVVFGRDLPIGAGEPVKLLQLVQKAKFDRNVGFLERASADDGWDEGFYSRDPRGVELEVVRNRGTKDEWRETVRMATVEPYNIWQSPDNGLVIRFFENDKMLPFEWRSVLSVVERDNEGKPYVVPLGSERKREIRVNDYFQYRGYRFFQTNANADNPNYSGIGVVWDPGIEIVLLGMYTVIAGTALAFLVRPIVKGRRRLEAA